MRHELFRSIELLSKTFPFCNCFNRTIHWRDNRNISKKNHLWTMQKLSWAYFGPYTQNAIFHVEIYSVGNFFSLFLSIHLPIYGCEFDISSLHKSNTSWANTYFEYIWVISFFCVLPFFRYRLLVLITSHTSNDELIFVHRLQK